ncbi:MAG: type I methionyl aminopeptidase [Anaerovoracaceae bacterium]
MIIIKSPSEIQIMGESGKVTARILKELEAVIKPGITTKDVDDFVEDIIRKEGMIPSFKGYNGFPASSCVSINEEIVHGIPKSSRFLREGDIVSVDVGTTFKGYISDAARTYPVGKVDPKALQLIKITEESFFEGLKFCREGMRLGDISNAIQTHIENAGFSVIREFVGHGVGKDMHEEPQIPNYGLKGRGPRLISGMVFAIEPMVALGRYEIRVLLDNWTAVTRDGSLAAHYENTVVITEGEPELLTL